jgi:hypothetical protein
MKPLRGRRGRYAQHGPGKVVADTACVESARTDFNRDLSSRTGLVKLRHCKRPIACSTAPRKNAVGMLQCRGEGFLSGTSGKISWHNDHLFLGNQPTDLRIVADERWPAMWRVRRADGSLSDMTNRSRARDAATVLLGRHLRRGDSHAEAPYSAPTEQAVVR